MNAQIGKNENNEFSLHNSSNRNWEFLTDFSLENGLIIFTNPSTRAGYDTRSIFKLSLTGLNSEFSFPLD